MRSVNRRVLFSTSVAAGLVGAAGTVLPAEASTLSPDSRLIALCDEFCRMERESMALFYGPDAIEDDDERTPFHVAVIKRQEPVVEEIMRVRATTLEGVKAKAKAIVAWDKFDDLFDRDSECRGDRMLFDLICDLTGMNGRLPSV